MTHWCIVRTEEDGQERGLATAIADLGFLTSVPELSRFRVRNSRWKKQHRFWSRPVLPGIVFADYACAHDARLPDLTRQGFDSLYRDMTQVPLKVPHVALLEFVNTIEAENQRIERQYRRLIDKHRTGRSKNKWENVPRDELMARWLGIQGITEEAA